MANKFGYEQMLSVAANMGVNLDNMSQAVDGFASATDTYSAQVSDAISAAAIVLVAELRQHIEDTRQTLIKINEALNAGASILAESETNDARDIGGF